ncbi:MAG: hypothetical protein QG608_643 [Actinomycetota bacterium]|nr:hypothetical protein [Actinomycetota bacterium]
MAVTKQPITRIRAQNFRSLAEVEVPLRPLTVLVGPNGSGKTNVLNVLRFLAATVRFDLNSAVHQWRGFEHVQRQSQKTGQVLLEVQGRVTEHSSASSPDVYQLKLSGNAASGRISRTEEFTFKRIGGRGRRLTVKGNTVTITDTAKGSGPATSLSRKLADSRTTGLATLPKLSDDEGGEGLRRFTEFLTGIRVLEPDISAARMPSRTSGAPLAEDAGNLADVLAGIEQRDKDAWGILRRDLASCLPGLQDILLAPVGGPLRGTTVQLLERGVSQPVDLADASFGTVRLLAILAALHQPDPAPFTAIEEIDHGLHPYALDLLVDRLRAASERTQILVTTHSPTLVNRLRPEEIVVCDRDPDTGASLIPAISQNSIEDAVRASDRRPGELWFSGALGGVPA